MENKIATLETLRSKGKELWITYFKEADAKKATNVLKQRSNTMEKIHTLQDQINEYLFANLSA
jgi:hypothetical protein